ncbi:MAG: NAD(P)-dependent oxidoreductase [Pseudomonadota bacterium]
MKVLVTGSAGHLGEALCIMLNQAGATTIGLDIKPSPHTDRVGSITDRDLVSQSMAGADAIVHCATLHKPHVGTHTRQDFIDTNISGTLNLLECAIEQTIGAFVYTSTTSTFGDAMQPGSDNRAIWVDEQLPPQPKNIYGVTKTAAEDLCQMFHRNTGMPCVVLKTSRFFLEKDDNNAMAERFDDNNIKVNELLYRRADIADMADAHICALEKAPELGFDRLIITATPPFAKADLEELIDDAPAVVARYFPSYQSLYDKLDWRMFPSIERVYDNSRAKERLEWEPKFGFEQALAALSRGDSFKSSLASQIGVKGYHEQQFADGIYPVDSF